MLYLKALHIIFVITWFAGLFYIVRLFVYHAEADKLPEPDRTVLSSHFKGAQKRLWYGITWPSAVLTWLFGWWLALDMFGTDFPLWLWIKFGLVTVLTVYHLLCGRIFSAFQKNKLVYTGMQMRIWNEVATILLVAIVFMVVLKSTLDVVYGIAGLLVFSIAIMAAIGIYKRIRTRG